MKTQNILSTNEIMGKIINQEEIPPKKIKFNTDSKIKDQLYKDIVNSGTSINSFANSCGIAPSHLHDFLNSNKKMSRDKVVSICIQLGYNIPKMQTVLESLALPVLYAKNQRDYLILCNIQKQTSLSGINDLLSNRGLELLCNQK